MFEIEDVGVFLGLDVGKSAHHGHGLTPAGKKVFDKPLPNSEPKLRAVFDKLTAKFGTVLVIVDQRASIGALGQGVARDAGCRVAYLPGLAMRRIADLYPGEAKTDAKDAAVIADAARTVPHTLRSLEPSDEITAGLTVLTGRREPLVTHLCLRVHMIIRGWCVDHLRVPSFAGRRPAAWTGQQSYHCPHAAPSRTAIRMRLAPRCAGPVSHVPWVRRGGAASEPPVPPRPGPRWRRSTSA
ncbi:IS110 family transposase [Streptomyces clavifer]